MMVPGTTAQAKGLGVPVGSECELSGWSLGAFGKNQMEMVLEKSVHSSCFLVQYPPCHYPEIFPENLTLPFFFFGDRANSLPARYVPLLSAVIDNLQ